MNDTSKRTDRQAKTKPSELSRRIASIQRKLEVNQADFAKLVKVRPSFLSDIKAGRKTRLSPKLSLRIAIIALKNRHDPEARWFSKNAGIDPNSVLDLSELLRGELNIKKPSPGEWFAVPITSETEQSGDSLFFPRSLVPRPDETRYVRTVKNEAEDGIREDDSAIRGTLLVERWNVGDLWLLKDKCVAFVEREAVGPLNFRTVAAGWLKIIRHDPAPKTFPPFAFAVMSPLLRLEALVRAVIADAEKSHGPVTLKPGYTFLGRVVAWLPEVKENTAKK